VAHADAIEASNSNELSSILTAVRKQWAISRKLPATRSIETQTDETPVKQATQTSKDEGVQTDEVPVEKAVQSPDEIATQTEVRIVSYEQDQEEKWFFSTLFQTVECMMNYLETEIHAEGWSDIINRFQYADKMMDAGCPIPATLRRRKRHQKAESFIAIPRRSKRTKADQGHVKKSKWS